MIKDRISSGDHLFGREVGTVGTVDMKKGCVEFNSPQGPHFSTTEQAVMDCIVGFCVFHVICDFSCYLGKNHFNHHPLGCDGGNCILSTVLNDI